MNNNKAGFTLIELSIYVTLVAGILVMATSFSWNIINSRTKSLAMRTVEQDGRFILEKFTQAVRQASAVSSPAVGGSDDQLVLTMTDPADDPIVFSLSGDKLTFQRGSGPAIQLHSDRTIVTASFTNHTSLDGKTRNVSIALSLEHVNPDQQQPWEYQQDFTTTVELRDY